MELHPWWAGFGVAAACLEGVGTHADSFWKAAASGVAGANLVEIRYDSNTGVVGLRLDIDVERPQDLAFPIRSIEPVAVLLSAHDQAQPTVLALRQGFPDTLHQNWVPEGMPPALCIDDRPWAEARLSWTPADTIRRIQLWLAKAARGDLHETARPLEPHFFPAPRSLVIPRAALEQSEGKPVELVGFVHAEDNRVVVTHDVARFSGKLPDTGRLLVTVHRAGERPMGSMKHAPATLGSLAHELSASGVDLAKALKQRMYDWAGLKGDDVRRLTSSLAIVVAFPVRGADGRIADDVKAFVTALSAGEVGVALGALYRNDSGKGAKDAFVRAMLAGAMKIDDVIIEPCEVHLAFDRELGAVMGGRQVDQRRAVLVGAGSLGSQLALNLAREGAFIWSVVDEDRLLPHNLARHALSCEDVGLPKAIALARKIEMLTGEPMTAIFTGVERPGPKEAEPLGEAFVRADVIIDASASVAAARHLSDMQAGARRVSAFFNPAGTDVVILTEAADRTVTLRDLEGQYYSLLLSDPVLAGHLGADQGRIRYSGSCRSLTNRIPASNAALLSAIASRGITRGLQEEHGTVRIWSVGDSGEIKLVERQGIAVTRVEISGWQLAYDQSVLDVMSALRDAQLPAETGGVLLGVADMSRRSIHVVAALPAPADSVGTAAGFERGVDGLGAEIARASAIAMHQVRYVGEWHSHPARASAMPSQIDIRQLQWLRAELSVDGLPALMAIAADDGRFSFIVSGEGDRP